VRQLAALSLAIAAVIAARPAVAQDDAFLRGYVSAVLEREFRVKTPPPSLRVEGGVVTVDEADLLDATRNMHAVEEELRKIKGVTRVVVKRAPEGSRYTWWGVPGTPGGALGEPDLKTGLFPGDQLFDSLVGDPRWPHFSAAVHRYLDNPTLRTAGSVSFGETFAAHRWREDRHVWELGIQAGVFALFDLEAESKDLINADYFVALFSAYRLGGFSALSRFFHQSSHLGDEFLLRNRVKRVNLSYESVDLKLSYELGDFLRFYAGTGYLFDQDPSSLKPWSTQWGVEFRHRRPVHRIHPIAAIDVQQRQQNDWHTDLSVRAGVQVDGVLATRSFQLLLEYFRGHSPNGQFYQNKVDYLGLGAHLHF
jgi:hypothetical protein